MILALTFIVGIKDFDYQYCSLFDFKEQRTLLETFFLFTGGFFSPDIARYSGMIKNVKFREYEFRQQKYYGDLLRDILLSRQVGGKQQE